MKKIICMLLLGLGSTASWSAEQTWCVFDPLNAQGEIGHSLEDIRLFALQQQVKIKIKSFKHEKDAIQAFDKKQCSGLVASNFNTHRYNRFMSSTGAIGLIPNNRVMATFLKLLNHPQVEKSMVGADYEVLGMIPVGTAYMMTDTTQINKVSHLKNKTISILANNPPQLALVHSVGARPVYVDFSNAVDVFKQKKADVLVAPIYRILPYQLKKEFGQNTQVVNFPVAYFAISIIIRQDAYPKGFGHKMRGWFVSNSSALTAQAIQWDNHLPAYNWADIPHNEVHVYEAIVTKVRNRYVASGYYDGFMVELMRRLRCLDEPKYIECRQ